MIRFKNEHKSDKETYVALTRAFFTSLSPVRAILNYILAALLLVFGSTPGCWAVPWKIRRRL